MALNETQYPGWGLTVTKASVASGDPVAVGQITGVANVASYTDAAGNANQVVIDTGPKVWQLSVKGVDGGGNSAVAVGDAIYYVEGDTPKLSKKATGVLFGYVPPQVAGQAAGVTVITSGSTATINVRHRAE